MKKKLLALLIVSVLTFGLLVSCDGHVDQLLWNCKVAFDDGLGVKVSDVKRNTPVSYPLPNPVKDDSIFMGWYTDKACTAGNEYDFDNPVSAAKTLYGKWIPAAGSVKVADVTLSKAKLNLLINESKTISSVVTPTNATNDDVVWTSSNSSVATVDKTGKVSAIAVGDAIIKATTVDGNKTDTCSVKVTLEPSTTGSASVSSTSGRSECEWVQLWEDGPKWAKFNVGSTITSYANNTALTTAAIGGLYKWGATSAGGARSSKKTDIQYTDDDTAKAIWGSNWQMPKEEDLCKLINKQSNGSTPLVTPLTRWEYMNGSTKQFEPGCTLKGWKVSGQTGTDYEDNCIFLPNNLDGGVKLWYWSSTYVYTNEAPILKSDFGASPSVPIADKSNQYCVRAILYENED